MNKILAIFLVLCFSACSQEKVSIEGTLTLGSSSLDKPLLNHPVLILTDSLAAKELDQWRMGYKQEMAKISEANKGIGVLLDSLQSVFKKSGDKKTEARYQAVVDSGSALKIQTEKYQRELFRAISTALAKKAIAGVNTDNTGKFKIENLNIGKYILLSGYDSKNSSGLLIKPIDLKSKTLADITYRDADEILNFRIEE